MPTVSTTPAVAPLHPWQWPTRLWSRLHIDYASPLENKMFLIVIDAHSKWIEVFPMTSATALTTVQHLHQLVSRFGIPDSIVSDNGSVCCQRVSRFLQVLWYLTHSCSTIPLLIEWACRGCCSSIQARYEES